MDSFRPVLRVKFETVPFFFEIFGVNRASKHPFRKPKTTDSHFSAFAEALERKFGRAAEK